MDKMTKERAESKQGRAGVGQRLKDSPIGNRAWVHGHNAGKKDETALPLLWSGVACPDVHV